MLVSDEEMDSLKEANPDMFSDDLNVRFKDTKFTFVDKNGRETVVTGYKALNEKQKKSVSYAPEMYAMNMTIYEPVKTTETVKLPEPIERDTKEFNLNQDSVAQYPGGLEAFNTFFFKDFNVPIMPSGTYKIYVSFTVEKDGSLSDIKYAKGDENFKNEAIRVLKKCDKWIPAKKDGIAIRSRMNIPMNITIKQ